MDHAAHFSCDTRCHNEAISIAFGCATQKCDSRLRVQQKGKNVGSGCIEEVQCQVTLMPLNQKAAVMKPFIESAQSSKLKIYLGLL